MSRVTTAKEGGVAVLDVLGVKGMWTREVISTVIEKWKGVISDFFTLEKNVSGGGSSGWFVRYDIPDKDGVHLEGWALDWPNQISAVMKLIPDKRDPTDAIYEAFATPPIDADSISKYRNTLTF